LIRIGPRVYLAARLHCLAGFLGLWLSTLSCMQTRR
jgi:hypothetical protein